MTFHLPLFPAALLCAAVGLSGCHTASSPAADPGVSKGNAYIACYNGVERPIRAGFEQYIGWMKDPEAGPTGKEEQPRSPGTVLSNRVDHCGQRLTDALALTPVSALDEPVRAYQTAFQSLYARIESADSYFSSEAYRRDGGEGMRALHGPLMQDYSAFFAASEVLDAALEAHETERDAAELKRIEASEGRSAAYYRLRVLGDGKQLVMVMQSDAPDLDVARTRLAAYQALLTDISTSGVGKDYPQWSYVQFNANALVRNVGRAIERLSTGEPFTTAQLEAAHKAAGRRHTYVPQEGDQSKVVDAYNELVSASNLASNLAR